RIHEFGGRLPDLLFVRAERMDIVKERAVYGPPDVVFEIISPSDRRAGLVSRESDYRSIGIPEIVFINQKRREVRVLRKRGDNYLEQLIKNGSVVLEGFDGFWLSLEWLFTEARPSVRDAVDRILNEQPD